MSRSDDSRDESRPAGRRKRSRSSEEEDDAPSARGASSRGSNRLEDRYERIRERDSSYSRRDRSRDRPTTRGRRRSSDRRDRRRSRRSSSSDESSDDSYERRRRRRRRDNSPERRRDSRDSKTEIASRDRSSTVVAPPSSQSITDVKKQDPDDVSALLGFAAFGSTAGKAVERNAKGYARKDKTRKARQYMNRIGGFNRELS